MRLIRDKEDFPQDWSVVSTVEVPAILVSVARLEVESIDVTSSMDGNFRHFIPGMCTVYGNDGSVLMTAHPMLVDAALHGGGKFHWIEQNQPAAVQTREEHEAEELALAEADALDYADWD